MELTLVLNCSLLSSEARHSVITGGGGGGGENASGMCAFTLGAINDRHIRRSTTHLHMLNCTAKRQPVKQVK